ncbi:MAG TPA: hypothetical protein VFT65_18950 [Candidatus Angelobacter sp.]|nr:hypothetical protein [Candidatus Angelobacter sp.]
MRIISIRLSPVARVLAIAYAVFGLGAFLVYAFGSAQYFTLPLGIIGPVFHLNLNINLARSGGVLYNIYLLAAAVLSYALTGWITGMAAAACFNVVAKQTGGIDAKYVFLADDGSSADQT